jgi:hypothetical protein
MLTALREGLSWFFAAIILFVALLFTMTAEVMAADAAEVAAIDVAETGDFDDDIFQIGGSCAGLAYLGGAEIRHLLSQAFSDDHHSFCYPEEPSDCTDYSSFLKGLGRMTTGDDGYHCAVHLQL